VPPRVKSADEIEASSFDIQTLLDKFKIGQIME
jgi:hypothetical protein